MFDLHKTLKHKFTDKLIVLKIQNFQPLLNNLDMIPHLHIATTGHGSAAADTLDIRWLYVLGEKHSRETATQLAACQAALQGLIRTSLSNRVVSVEVAEEAM